VAAPTTCPKCESDHVRRSSRRGIFERLLSVAYVYPFRCPYCNYRFRSMQWGERYRQIPVDQRAFERITVKIPCVIRWKDRAENGAVRNFSAAGCKVEVDVPFADGDLVQIELLPENELPIAVDVAEVRTARPGALGLRFVTFQPGHAERLQDLVVKLTVTTSS
jgi:hypothetical protein